MATERDRTDRDPMRNEEQKDSRLASTKEDTSLSEQVLGDSPNPDVHRDLKREDEDHRP